MPGELTFSNQVFVGTTCTYAMKLLTHVHCGQEPLECHRPKDERSGNPFQSRDVLQFCLNEARLGLCGEYDFFQEGRDLLR